MIIRHTPIFFKLFTKKWVSGIALYPFILFRNKETLQNECTINHEKIHIRQQAELGVVFFYLWYVIEYGWKWLALRNSFSAYKNISFEREAYENESDLEYLKHRKFWAFLKYI